MGIFLDSELILGIQVVSHVTKSADTLDFRGKDETNQLILQNLNLLILIKILARLTAGH